MKKDITVIIPINDILQDQFSDWFEKCINSIETQTVKPEKVLIVHCECPGVGEWLGEYDFGDLDVKLLKNTTEPMFTHQINFALDHVETEWFSILEFDDEYSNIWIKNVKEYMEAYPDVGIFLPLVLDVDHEGNFINFTNEACWAMNFTEKLGYLDNGALLNYQNFQTSGAVMKVEDVVNCGKFKNGMVLTFVYEFLLRATYNDVRILTVPKVGYKHTNMRPGSLFWEYKNGERLNLPPEVAKFWIDTAKKEYFFKEDRDIKYEEVTS
tara:strand:+ start:15654 stop:16457 length:804 start_codon:yes stop_codon:yes gene_type:complete